MICEQSSQSTCWKWAIDIYQRVLYQRVLRTIEQSINNITLYSTSLVCQFVWSFQTGG